MLPVLCQAWKTAAIMRPMRLNIISLNCISRLRQPAGEPARTLTLVYHQIQRNHGAELKLRGFISGSVLLWVQICNLSLELT